MPNENTHEPTPAGQPSAPPEGVVPLSTYTPSARVAAQIEKAFTYHAPKADQPARYTKLRNAARHFAEQIAELTPESREQSLALTKLEEAVMHANSAIARNE